MVNAVLKNKLQILDHVKIVVLTSILFSRSLKIFEDMTQCLLGHFQPNLAQSVLVCRGFKFVQIKGYAHFLGEIITKYIDEI